jgi:glutaredoxin
MRHFVALVLAFAAAAAAAQGVYRWTDANGKIHYTNEPPPGAKATAVRDRLNTTGTRFTATSTAQPVVMYATSWCPYCAKARDYFAKKGISYVEYDIERSAATNAEFKRLGGRGVPLILVGGEKMSGFSEEGFEALRSRAARAR